MDVRAKHRTAEAQGQSSLAGRAYALIEEAIVTLRLNPGTPATEAELCNLIGIGRTPVREAIQKLAADGLIQVYPRRGLVIPPISATELHAVLEVREPLERIIAGHAALRGIESERNELKMLASSMKRAAHAHEPARYMEHDKAIDTLMGQMARADHASKALMPLQVISRRYWYLHWREKDLLAAASCHVKLAEAVIDRSAGLARSASDALIGHLRRRLSGHFSAN